MVSVTSALLRIGRDPVPPKITSSIPAPRIEVGRFSPITQRIASSRLDLPQPFGPTIPLNPGSMNNSVGSTKDLKPLSRRRVNFNVWSLLRPPAGVSSLHKRIENLLQLIVGDFAGVRCPVDDEGRRRIHVELGLAFHPVTVDQRQVLGVVGAGFVLVRRKTGDTAHLGKTFEHVLNAPDVGATPLLPHYNFNDPTQTHLEHLDSKRRLAAAACSAAGGC